MFFVELIQRVMIEVVHRALKGLYSKLSFVGSTYEFSSLYGASDFDVQVFLRMPSCSAAMVEPCDRPGWRKIKGGPQDVLTPDGYLSACKVCFISGLSMMLQKHCS